MAETKSRYSQRLDRERAEGVREGRLQARESRVGERERSLARSKPSRAKRTVATTKTVASAPVQATRKAKRTPYIALSFATMLIAWVQLGRNDKLQKNQKIAAGVSSVIVLLAIALLGEISPEIATGFATLLFLSVLLGGTDAVSYIFETIPHNLLGGGA